jgi:soluble lytic murein transglycosylase-like protein
MDHLHFSPRLRRKRRRQRMFLVLWLTTIIAAAGGVPGTQMGFDVLAKLAGGNGDSHVAGGIETTESAQSALRFREKVFAKRPKPTPSAAPSVASVTEETPSTIPVVPVAPAGSISGIIQAAAAEYGVDPGYLLSIASCESGLNPNAYNPAGYYGLFQFAEATWAGNGYGSIWDPVAQSRTAARMIAGGGAGAWGCA